MDDKIFEEALDVISDGKEEISLEKKVVFDKKTEQISIKIPRNLSLKKDLDNESIFEIVINPREETIKEAQESGLILFLKKRSDGQKETGA